MSIDHYENFPVASLLLPPHLRKAVAAIYWFARSADDIADEGSASPEARLQDLASYQAYLIRIEHGDDLAHMQFKQLGEIIRAHKLPIALFRDLLDAFIQDVTKQRYADQVELLDYCHRSADPIGRLLLRLYRAESSQQLQWSDAICTSLQLINHWQDIAIDWRKPRVYVPADVMQHFGISDAHMQDQILDEAWCNMMRHLVTHARQVMLSGAPLARTLPGRIGLELRLIVCGGLRILEKIEAVGYDVFHRRPVLNALDWPLLLWRAIFAYPPKP